jgi:hypothetical protein
MPGFALISDGLQNVGIRPTLDALLTGLQNIMSLTNVVFGQIYGSAYNSVWSTQLSNSLTVGTTLV